MKGRTAIITGSSRGIGAQTARLLGSRGANVVVNYFSNAQAAENVVKDIEDNGGKAIAVKGDARDTEDVANIVKQALATFGSVDILVHNAGMQFPFKSFEDMEWDEFIAKTDDELKAAFTSTKAVVPIMKEQGYGKLVYISSGLSHQPMDDFLAHGTSKSALNAFAKYIAQEFADTGITSNIVAPGMVDTDATAHTPEEAKTAYANSIPIHRLAQPEDVAKAVAFYASEDSAYITGSYLPVSGGGEMI